MGVRAFGKHLPFLVAFGSVWLPACMGHDEPLHVRMTDVAFQSSSAINGFLSDCLGTTAVSALLFGHPIPFEQGVNLFRSRCRPLGPLVHRKNAVCPSQVSVLTGQVSGDGGQEMTGGKACQRMGVTGEPVRTQLAASGTATVPIKARVSVRGFPDCLLV